ncbi:unnamed protein product [Closterium sp. NIES-54]
MNVVVEIDAKDRASAGSMPRKEADDEDVAGKGRGLLQRQCLRRHSARVSMVEPNFLLAPQVGKDFKAVAAAVQANSTVVLLDSGCSHHLMGTQEAFVNMQPSGNVSHVRAFNGAIQVVQGRSTITLQGEARKQILVPNVLYNPAVQVNPLSTGQLKDSGAKL